MHDLVQNLSVSSAHIGNGLTQLCKYDSYISEGEFNHTLPQTLPDARDVQDRLDIAIERWGSREMGVPCKMKSDLVGRVKGKGT
jgi:hypothetical protein